MVLYSEMTPNTSFFSSPDGAEYLRALLKAAEGHLGWDFQSSSKDRGVHDSGLRWHLLDIFSKTSSEYHCQLWVANVAVVRRVEKEGLCGDEATTPQTRFQPTNLDINYFLTDTLTFAILSANEPVVFPPAFTAMAMLNILKPAARLQIGQLFLELINESKTTANRASVFHQV